MFRDNLCLEQGTHRWENTAIHTITFVKLNGQAFLFRYLYLVAVFLDRTDNGDSITVHFTTHRITLAGFGLRDLFVHLGEQSIALITESHSRYRPIGTATKPFVTEIRLHPRPSPNIPASPKE